MPKSLIRLAFGVLVGGLLLTSRQVHAQGPMGPAGMATGSNPMLNPYTNPYANPLLNPALTIGTTNRSDALLYLWSAQQQPGGLLSASAAGGRPRAAASGSSRVAEMPKSAMTPGGSASKYFNRGMTSVQAGSAPASRYGRHGRYFGQNGR